MQFDYVHVIPVDDLKEHICSDGCWCCPQADDEEPLVFIHNALDQRELIESAERCIQ